MNVDEALRQFADSEELPRAAMQWALDHWEAASPRFLSRLRAFAAAAAIPTSPRRSVLHPPSLRREGRDASLCALVRDDRRDPDIDEWLGDAVTETLPGILIKVFDGDVGPLRARSNPERLRIRARFGAGGAGLSGAREGRHERRGHARLFARDSPRSGAARRLPSSGRCGRPRPPTLASAICVWTPSCSTRKDSIDDRDFDADDFDRKIALARSDPAGLAGFEHDLVRPFDDAIGTLESWVFR